MFYKVNLYSHVDLYLENVGLDINNDIIVYTVIVKKGLFSVKEIITNYKFPVDLPNHCFIKKEQLNSNNIATLDDVKSYAENFDLEKFDNILKNYNHNNIAIKDQKKIKKYLKQRR